MSSIEEARVPLGVWDLFQRAMDRSVQSGAIDYEDPAMAILRRMQNTNVHPEDPMERAVRLVLHAMIVDVRETIIALALAVDLEIDEMKEKTMPTVNLDAQDPKILEDAAVLLMKKSAERAAELGENYPTKR